MKKTIVMKDFKTKQVYLLFSLMLALTTQPGIAKCRFPADWRGKYFQGGHGEVVIRDSYISSKGICIKQSKDYYLLDNKEHNCRYCLFILSQHRNLIQYKESHCSNSLDLKIVCDQINVDFPLHTIIKENASPEPFPFSSIYNFSYADGISGNCSAKLSTAIPCSSNTRYSLKFKHCQPSTSYNGQEIEMESLAGWKVGSESFMYARLYSPALTQKEDIYKCLSYVKNGDSLTLSMSIDATCRGLRSLSDGHFQIQFEKVEMSSQECRFPHWLNTILWRDASGKLHLQKKDRDQELILTLRKATNTGLIREETVGIHYCKRLLARTRQEDQSETFTYLTFSTVGCNSQDKCMRLHRSANDILSIEEGVMEYSKGSPHLVCSSNSSFTHHRYYLPSNISGTSCPESGIHHTAVTNGCLHRLNIGCKHPSTIHIDHSCDLGQPVSLECLVMWTESTTSSSYVIVKSQTDDTIACYSFRKHENEKVFSYDKNCFFNKPYPFQLPYTSRRFNKYLRSHSHIYKITRQDECRTRRPNHSGNRNKLNKIPVRPQNRTYQTKFSKSRPLNVGTTSPPLYTGSIISKAQTLKIFDEDEETEDYNSKEDEGSGDDYVVNNSNYNSQKNQYTRLKDYLNYNKNGLVRQDKQNKRNQQFKNQFKGFTSSEVVGGSILNKNNVKYDTYQENIHDQDSWEHPKIGNKNNYFERNDKGLEPNVHNGNSHNHFDPKNNINIYQPNNHQHMFTSNKRNNNHNKVYNRSHYNFPRKKVAVIDGNHMKPSQSFFSSSASSTPFPSLALLLIFSVSISSICEVLAAFEVYIKKIICKLMCQIIILKFFSFLSFLKSKWIERNTILAVWAQFPPKEIFILSEYYPRKEKKAFLKIFWLKNRSKLFKTFPKVDIEKRVTKIIKVTGIMMNENNFTEKKICMQNCNLLIDVNNKILKFHVMRNLSSMRICIFSKHGFKSQNQIFEENNANFFINNKTSSKFHCRALTINIPEFNLKRIKYNFSSKSFFKPKKPLQTQNTFCHKKLFLIKISDQLKHLSPLQTNTELIAPYLISSQASSYLESTYYMSSIKSSYERSSIASRLSDA